MPSVAKNDTQMLNGIEKEEEEEEEEERGGKRRSATSAAAQSIMFLSPSTHRGRRGIPKDTHIVAETQCILSREDVTFPVRLSLVPFVSPALWTGGVFGSSGKFRIGNVI